jgi:hypothetical protein
MAAGKVPGYGLAVGYWGRNVHSHVTLAEQIPQKALALNRDKIFTLGLPFFAYQSTQPLYPTHDPHITQCSCWKDTSQQADVACYSCYGERYIPGYFKFGFQTMWWSSVDTWTMTNTFLDQTITPWRFKLSPNQLSGTIVSLPQVVQQAPQGPWEAHADYSTRNPPSPAQQNATVTVKFSVNGGPLYDINAISIVNPQPGQSIQWTVTMTRVDCDTPSPLFEIVRARYPSVPMIVSMRPDIPSQGAILVLRTWEMEKFSREQAGTRLETQGESYWTLPLNFFDPSLPPDTRYTKFGPRYFIKKASGFEAGVCYVPTPPFSYSEQFYLFTRQQFGLRRAVGDPVKINTTNIDGEVYYSVF